MELLDQNNNKEHISVENPKEKTNYWKWVAVGFVGLFIFTQLFDVSISPRFGSGRNQQANVAQNQDNSVLEKIVLPSEGIPLPIEWGNLGAKMIEAGVIDRNKFESLYVQRGGLDEDTKRLLYGTNNGKLKINEQNSGFLLNLLWAFSLANQNKILEEGPIQDKQYGGDASRFASTGGWSLAVGDVIDHYSKHPFVILTSEQQSLVEKVSQNIYRPCCGNSTYFPDCNHGMAMLGLLELMASQGISEEEMYRTALQVNSYWFPDTYLTIAKYFDARGVEWNELNAKEIFGSTYSSAQGYRQILAEIEPVSPRSSEGCGV